jgi:hypothetical protein
MEPLQLLTSKYLHFRSRWEERNSRMIDVTNAVNGVWTDVDDPQDRAIKDRSPNMVAVALEDTAESSSLVPTVRVTPSDPADQSSIDRAREMERYAVSYMDTSSFELLAIRSFMDLAAYGMFTWIVVNDPETGGPIFQWRDPQTCFPEPGWKTMDSPREVFFARELYLSQLPDDWVAKVRAEWPDTERFDIATYTSKKVILVEHFTEEDWLLAVLFQTGVQTPGGGITYTPIELERGENPGGICPVVVGQRISLDNEPRGQFDQVIGILKAHIRLMGMVLDYADQAVYSDVWVKDLIGPLNYGGGAYIQLGPNGAIGRVPPAVTDLSVFREMDQLVDSMHLAARWPKTRPGEIDQAIASAKFVEATAGVMNTVIRTYHLIMKRVLERAIRVAFVIDKKQGRSRAISGVLRNQQFIIARDAGQIDLEAKVRVEYGLGLGRDPAQAMVLGIQASQAGFVSREFVQENFEGIQDVALEQARIDVERLRDMAFARMLQGLEAGAVPEEAIVDMARNRMNGDDIFELFERYVVKPKQAQQDQMLQPGLPGGAPMMPGQAPAPAGGPAPAPPSPEQLLGALGGGGAPPEGPEGISRLSVPLGNGSFAGTQASTGP